MKSITLKSIITLSALSLGLLLSGCGSSESDEGSESSERSFKVSLATVQESSWERKAQAVGSLLAENQTTLKSALSGRIRMIHFEEGDTVKQGDLIIELDDDILQLERDRAVAILEDAEAEFQRQERLFQADGVSEASLVRARTARDRAAAEKALVERRIEDSRVTAPFDGQLGRRMVSTGDFLNVGEALFELTGTDRLRLEFSLPEKYLREVRVGQTVHFSIASLRGENFSGEVYFIDPRVDPRARTVRLRAWVPNEDDKLKPNLFGRVILNLAEIPDVIVVPEDALITELGGFFVYVVDDENRARMRQVVPEERGDGLIWLSKGVEAGERIVREGHQRISDGSLVNWSQDN